MTRWIAAEVLYRQIVESSVAEICVYSVLRTVVNLGLPRIPLVPVSSSQAVAGAVCGLASARGIKGARQIRWRMLRNIAIGWVATPVIAAVISYIALYFVQNVFQQVVFV